MNKSPEYWKGLEEGKKHTEPSPATLKIIEELRDEFVGEVKKITKKLDIMYPSFQKDLERDHAYEIVKGDIAKSSGYVKWLAGALVAFGVVSGYLQTAIKLFLGIK